MKVDRFHYCTHTQNEYTQWWLIMKSNWRLHRQRSLSLHKNKISVLNSLFFDPHHLWIRSDSSHTVSSHHPESCEGRRDIRTLVRLAKAAFRSRSDSGEHQGLEVITSIQQLRPTQQAEWIWEMNASFWRCWTICKSQLLFKLVRVCLCIQFVFLYRIVLHVKSGTGLDPYFRQLTYVDLL